ncbi:MAG: hypothetical protein CSA36_04030 [Draconibacterium sp.]|nr:MAG: hypothetical protein CSA36_04030 [Draconibacterium sp.]
MKAGWFVFILLMAAWHCTGQPIDKLKRQREKAVKEIEYTTRLLNEVEKNRKMSVNRLRLINSKIGQRNNLIKSISGEIQVYNECIANNNLMIDMLRNDLEKLKKEYAKIIVSTYKNKFAGDYLLFLLASVDFNQAYRRYLYLKKYTAYRESQAVVMESLQTAISQKRADLERKKQIKNKLSQQTTKERSKLVKEKQQQNNVLKGLQQERNTLRQKLAQQRHVEQQLENEIQRLIAEEAAKNRSEGKAGYALTPDQKLVGDSFEQNKSRLPWPVERGIITEHFGIHQHPVLSNIQIRNNGVNISTEAGAGVRAVFNGEVSRVFGISGGNTAVIIRHGQYLTVYSNLRESIVKKGEKVVTRQPIGTVYTDTDNGNRSVLKFQIWKENKKLNPEEWIGK